MVESPAPDRARARECASFCRYLVQRPPSDYVQRKYAEGNTALGLSAPPPELIERALLAAASASPWLARASDAYSRFFRPRSRLRARLVLLLAILESSAPTEARFRAARATTPARVFGSLLRHGLGMVVALAAGVLLFAPVHLASSLSARGRAREVRPVTLLEP